jgi:hypothetical protein
MFCSQEYGLPVLVNTPKKLLRIILARQRKPEGGTHHVFPLQAYFRELLKA